MPLLFTLLIALSLSFSLAAVVFPFQDDEEELEIEINNLDPTTLHQLNAFCEQCINAKGGAVKNENGGAETPKTKKK